LKTDLDNDFDKYSWQTAAFFYLYITHMQAAAGLDGRRK